MKTLIKTLGELALAGRWDIDFHLPPEGIKRFPTAVLKRVDEVADIFKGKRDPSKDPETVFQYIDIASIDVLTGVIVNPQELTGDEAPSRARKVVRAFDIVVSTCRPTRGAISVVPENLHNQIASTAFSIVRAKPGINPYYLHYALRLESTLEQFRKWSTGSSYPAILDEDVKKTKIPVPDSAAQDKIAAFLVASNRERDHVISLANKKFGDALAQISQTLESGKGGTFPVPLPEICCSISEIKAKLENLPPLTVDSSGDSGNGSLEEIIENGS